MKAALRDAKRAEAIRDRPKGSTFAHAANGRRERTAPECQTCHAEMTDAGLGASGGICAGCAGRAQTARNAVIRQRAAHERAQRATLNVSHPTAIVDPAKHA